LLCAYAQDAIKSCMRLNSKASLSLSFDIKMQVRGQFFRPEKGPPVTNGSELHGALEVTWTP